MYRPLDSTPARFRTSILHHDNSESQVWADRWAGPGWKCLAVVYASNRFPKLVILAGATLVATPRSRHTEPEAHAEEPVVLVNELRRELPTHVPARPWTIHHQ